MTEVLLARTASGRRVRLEPREELLLQREILGRRLEHEVGIRDGVLELARASVDRGRPVGVRRPSVARFARTRSGTDASASATRRRGRRTSQPRAAKHLGDAVPHEAGADDGRSVASRGHLSPAV